MEDDQQSYAKQQLGVKPNESKMLGLKWDKVQDTLTVNFPRSVDRNDTVTKRGILRNLAKIYFDFIDFDFIKNGTISPRYLQKLRRVIFQ